MTKTSTLLQWHILMIACAGKIGASTLRHRPLQVSMGNEAASTNQMKHEQQRSESDRQGQDHEHRSLVEFNDVIDDPFVCANECSDDEFCGRDLLCHKFESCELWYELGHPALTGREEADITDETKLNCVDIDDGLDRSFLWSNGICRDYSVPLAAAYFPVGSNPDDITSTCSRESEYDEDEGRAEFGLAFTRLCAAEPKPDFVFRCYDFSPNTNLTQHIADSSPPRDAANPGQYQVFELEFPYYNKEVIDGETHYTYYSFGTTRPNATKELEPTDLSGLLTSRLYENGSPDFVSSFPIDCMCKTNEFCGIDGNCHPFTCDHMFEFGPRDFTGYDEFAAGSSPELSCSEYEPCHLATGDVEPRTDNSNDICKFRFGEASTYRCSQDHVWTTSTVPFQDDPFLPFSRSCTATTPIGGTFTCVDMAETTPEDLDRYVNATMQLGEVCAAEDSSHIFDDDDDDDGDDDYFDDDDVSPTFSRYFVSTSCTENSSHRACIHVSVSRDRFFQPLKALAVIRSAFEPAKINDETLNSSGDDNDEKLASSGGVPAAHAWTGVLAWMTAVVIVLGS